MLGPWIAGKIEAKEEAVAGEGNGMRTRTQVLKLASGLNEPEVDDTCIARDFVARGRLKKLAPLAKLVRSNCSESSISFSKALSLFPHGLSSPDQKYFIESPFLCVVVPNRQT